MNVKEEAGKRRISEEEAGRILRYQVFEREAGRWEQELRREKTAEPDGSQPESVKIAVAHHGTTARRRSSISSFAAAA